jgi:PST family polysaccharide transporter
LTIAAIRPGEHLLIELTAIAASGFLFEAFQTLALWFQSQIQAKYAVVAKSSILILMNLVKIVLLLGVASIHAFVWAACVESLLVAVALAAIYRFKGNSFRNWRYNPAYAWGLLRECWPLAVAGLVGIAYGKLSQLMIGGMLGNEAVGIYSAAVRLSDAWTVIPVAIITSAFPSLVAAQNVSPTLYTRRLQTLCNIITALGVAVAIPMTVLATPVIEAFFGSAYAAAGPVLAISVWGGVFVFMGMVQSCWYISEGLTRMALKRTIICALLNVALNAILIPRYAFIGAACATAITHAVNAWAINLTDARTRPFFLLQLRAFAFRPPVFRWSEPESIRG